MEGKCQYCNKKFTKKAAHQKFCCIKHKDKYHNRTNPRGWGSSYSERDVEDDFHPFDSYSLGQE